MTQTLQRDLFAPPQRRACFDDWFESGEGQAFYAEFCRRALALVAVGARPNAKGIAEEMRRESPHRMDPQHRGYRINNTFIAPLAHKAIETHPVLGTVFRTKGQP